MIAFSDQAHRSGRHLPSPCPTPCPSPPPPLHRLLVYQCNATARQYSQEAQLRDAVTTLVYFAGKVFAGDAAGHVSVFSRSTEGRQLSV